MFTPWRSAILSPCVVAFIPPPASSSLSRPKHRIPAVRPEEGATEGGSGEGQFAILVFVNPWLPPARFVADRILGLEREGRLGFAQVKVINADEEDAAEALRNLGGHMTPAVAFYWNLKPFTWIQADFPESQACASFAAEEKEYVGTLQSYL